MLKYGIFLNDDAITVHKHLIIKEFYFYLLILLNITFSTKI